MVFDEKRKGLGREDVRIGSPLGAELERKPCEFPHLRDHDDMPHTIHNN